MLHRHIEYFILLLRRYICPTDIFEEEKWCVWKEKYSLTKVFLIVPYLYIVNTVFLLCMGGNAVLMQCLKE